MCRLGHIVNFTNEEEKALYQQQQVGCQPIARNQSLGQEGMLVCASR